MSVDPDPGELFGLAARIDLGIEEIGHRLVEELDMDRRSPLVDELDIFHQQRIVDRGDAESANLGIAGIT